MKILYDQLAPIVDSLYDKVFPEGTPEKEIAAYCEEISSLIESSGWLIEDWTNEYISRGLKDLNPSYSLIDTKAN